MIYTKDELDAVKMIAYADADGEVRWDRPGRSEPARDSFAAGVRLWKGKTYISRGLHGVMCWYEVIRLEDRMGPWKAKIAFVQLARMSREDRAIMEMLSEAPYLLNDSMNRE